MSKKTIALILFAVVLGSAYLCYFTDFFRSPVIQISARPRMDRGSRQGAETFSVSFSFDTRCKLTELKVISVEDAATNKYPHAKWHLISDTASVPTKGIVYGEMLKGLKPKIPKTKAEPLQPQVKYRLLLVAGDRTGQVDFEIPGRRVR